MRWQKMCAPGGISPKPTLITVKPTRHFPFHSLENTKTNSVRFHTPSKQGTTLRTGQFAPSSVRLRGRGHHQVGPVAVESRDHDEHTDVAIRGAGHLRRIADHRVVQRRPKVSVSLPLHNIVYFAVLGTFV